MYKISYLALTILSLTKQLTKKPFESYFIAYKTTYKRSLLPKFHLQNKLLKTLHILYYIIAYKTTYKRPFFTSIASTKQPTKDLTYLA